MPVGEMITVSRKARPYRFVGLLRVGQRAIVWTLLVLLSTLFMLPFFWTLSTSLKAVTELFVFPPVWVPAVPQWRNYLEVWQTVPFGRWTWNTIVVTVLSVLGNILSCSLVAYAFARFTFPGRDALFMLCLSTMMLPVEVTIIPSYLMFNKIGWLDTFKPLIVPAFFARGTFYIFLLRQFFMTIPRELDDAAVMDGAGSLRILLNIILPLSRPALATVTVISIISNWGSFMEPLIFLNSRDKYLLSLGLRYFQTQQYMGGPTYDHLMMAASVIMSAPLVLLFFAAQRYFVRGVVMSGLKG